MQMPVLTVLKQKYQQYQLAVKRYCPYRFHYLFVKVSEIPIAILQKYRQYSIAIASDTDTNKPVFILPYVPSKRPSFYVLNDSVKN